MKRYRKSENQTYILSGKTIKEMKREYREKAEQHIQSKYARHASILLDWNDICNADMTTSYEFALHVNISADYLK